MYDATLLRKALKALSTAAFSAFVTKLSLVATDDGDSGGRFDEDLGLGWGAGEGRDAGI